MGGRRQLVHEAVGRSGGHWVPYEQTTLSYQFYLSCYMRPEEPWQQLRFYRSSTGTTFTDTPISCPRRGFRHTRTPLSPPPQYRRRRIAHQGNKQWKDKGKAQSRAAPGRPRPRSHLPPPPLPGAPKKPCTQPSCPARRSAPAPWLSRPRTFLGLRGHTGVSSHTFSLSSSAYSSPVESRLYTLRSGGTWTVVHRSHTASTVSRDLADLVTGTSQSLHAR